MSTKKSNITKSAAKAPRTIWQNPNFLTFLVCVILLCLPLFVQIINPLVLLSGSYILIPFYPQILAVGVWGVFILIVAAIGCLLAIKYLGKIGEAITRIAAIAACATYSLPTTFLVWNAHIDFSNLQF
ncbi:MAG TPA: hypothetical protein VM581_03925 [Magnetospirillaceae bacterium]|nr:hypothetical protein [Magnetospirillaceae bacterium]